VARSLDGVSVGKVVWLPMKVLVQALGWTSERVLINFLGDLCEMVMVKVFAELVGVRVPESRSG